MQNVWLKSHTRDVCGRFVVAVSFADGNVKELILCLKELILYLKGLCVEMRLCVCA